MRYRRSSGVTIVEVVMAAVLIAVAILSSAVLSIGGFRQLRESRDRSLARLAITRARESLATVRFRKLVSTETTPPSLFLGGFEIARAAGGEAFRFSDLSGVAATTEPTTDTHDTTFHQWTTTGWRTTVDGVANCVVLHFPVEPLKPATGRVLPGRIAFFTDETSNRTAPSAGFPFPATPGKAFLDLDGDGLATTGSIMTGHTSADPFPYRIVPVKIDVSWRVAGGANQSGGVGSETVTTYFLLTYPGYD